MLKFLNSLKKLKIICDSPNDLHWNCIFKYLELFICQGASLGPCLCGFYADSGQKKKLPVAVFSSLLNLVGDSSLELR